MKAICTLVVMLASLNERKTMRRVLVTGGNKGIGKAICQLLLEDHPDVHVLLGSRDADRGRKAVEDLQKLLGSICHNRLELVELDTSSDDSVYKAAVSIGPLFGIINNAGIGFGSSLAETLNTNYFGPRRVNDALSAHIQRPGGRIVNIASASGPVFVASCSDSVLREKLTFPESQFVGGIGELDNLAKSLQDAGTRNEAYGLSKALLNAYTILHAKSEPDLIINSVTPGFIATDITKGMGAYNLPSIGAIPPVWLLTSEAVGKQPTGLYYGSDCVRSPIFKYRGPGDPPFNGP